MQPPSPKPYSINDFIEWYARGEIVLSPKYQRRAVWSEKAQSYLMDTIVRGFPIPKIFIRHDVNMTTKKSYREIVDGQQRIRTILSFIKDGFKIMKVHNKDFGGLYFSELPGPIQKKILIYDISVDVLNEATDAEILEMFARINTYTVVLKKQELLNANYFGHFKTAAYSLGFEFSKFYLANKILKEKDITRMAEAELTSELLIVILDGIQDKKVIESYYKKYDDTFDKKEKVINRFKENIDTISQLFDGNLSNTHFSSKPLFYSLFSAINSFKDKTNLSKNLFSKISAALTEIDSVLENPPDLVSSRLRLFIDACTKHVTDLEARKIRYQYILSEIEKRLN